MGSQRKAFKQDCVSSWTFPSRSYWLQYAVDVIFVIACYAIVGGVDMYISPIARAFKLDDPSLDYPMLPDTVNYTVLVAASIATNFIVFIVAQIVVRSTLDLHYAIFGMVQAFAVVLLITEVVKVIAGRFRPDWYARCMPDPLSLEAAYNGHYNVTVICQQTDISILDDGRQSFFSGHTSTAFVLLGYLSLYVAGNIRPFTAGGHFYLFIIFLAPLCAATWVGISRTADNKHHFDDVLTGAAVGILFAVLIYFHHFPNPFRRDACGVDYPYMYYAMKKKQEEVNDESKTEEAEKGKSKFAEIVPQDEKEKVDKVQYSGNEAKEVELEERPEEGKKKKHRKKAKPDSEAQLKSEDKPDDSD